MNLPHYHKGQQNAESGVLAPSEAQAQKLGLLRKNSVYNPELLELQFGLPQGWTSPQECRAATQLLAPIKQPSDEYSTSTPSDLKEQGEQGRLLKQGEKDIFMPGGETCFIGTALKCHNWYIKIHFLELIVRLLGEIDLDPCADDGKHIPSSLHYTVVDNGLIHEWQGRVFMNPPYSCPGKWIAKLLWEVEAGRVTEAIALVSAATDTNWLSPLLATQPICFCLCTIKFLDSTYKRKKSLARQSHCLVYWGNNHEKFREVFEGYGVLHLPLPQLPHRENLVQEIDDGHAVCKSLLGDIENIPSKNISPSNKSPSKSQKQTDASPSNNLSSKNRRRRGNGSGSIHWRTITRNGKDYPQAYYHWKENGQKKTKYIPKHLLGVIQEAEEHKRPVIEILELLGVATSKSKLLGDTQASSSYGQVLGDIEISPSKDESPSEIYPSNDISPSKMRRHKGEGSGSIHWRTLTKNGKDYPQAYYHYEFWSEGDRLIKSTRYIPKHLLPRVQELEKNKAPVREILQLLGVKF